MKKLTLSLALATSALLAVPAQAAVVVNGSSGVAPTAGVPAGQGNVLASQSSTVQAETFAATFLSAVYLNALGTLDFYYQVLRTGAGSLSANGEIDKFTVSNFTGFSIDGFATGSTDPDGAGPFQGGANSTFADGSSGAVSTTSFGRSFLGDTLRVDFGLNGLGGSDSNATERSTTYIFRTNATTFDNLGTFGIINGSAAQGTTYRPTGTALPEPGTWAMMLVGFGFLGMALRRKDAATVTGRIRFA